MKNILVVWVGELIAERGGVQRVTSLLLDQFAQREYICYYIITNENYSGFYINNKKTPENFVSIEGLYNFITDNDIDVVIDQNAVFSCDIANIIKGLSFSKKIYYISVFHNSPLLYEKTFTRVFVKKKIFDAHSLKEKLFWTLKYAAYPIWKYLVLKGTANLYRTNYEQSDKCVVLSNADKPHLAKYLGIDKADKCIAIPNALSFDETQDDCIVHTKRKEVLIVSRLYNPEKRLDLALKIWKIIEEKGYTDWILKIVGEGPDEKHYKFFVKKYNLKRVVFEGRQSPLPYYKTASLFMMTSAIEGWGLTLTESMQTATVPMAFDSYPALQDIITDGYDGCVIKNNDIEAYVEKMEWLMTHEDERKQIALNGLKSAQRFTIDKIMDKWVEMIESL
jgi:glycosyltransferase involved in cell wall biosynthesis